MSSTSNIKLSIILKGEENWHEYIDGAETVGRKSDIWDYINPNTPRLALPALLTPTEPQFEDVCPRPEGSTDPITLNDLNANQLSRFNFLISQFNIKEKKYYAKKALIDDMRYQIQQTVQVEHFVYTTGCETTYDILVNLKKRFEPSTTIRERQLIREYNALKRLDATTQIEPWLMQWDVIVRKCQRIGLPETQGSRPSFDFIESIQDRFPTFFSIWQIRLIEEEDHTHTELFKLVQTFRDHLKSLKPTATRGKHTAFATFQDIQEGSSEQGNSTSQSNQRSRANSDNRQTRKPGQNCLCGKLHWFSDCFYLNSKLRPANWTPIASIQKKIADALSKSNRLKANITRNTTYFDDMQTQQPTNNAEGLKTSLCLFESTQNEHSTTRIKHNVDATETKQAFALRNPYNWDLYSSFILDSGSSTHVCNDISRFKNLRTEQHSVLCGGGNVMMRGIGDVDIQVQHPAGSRTITLREVSYNPDFPANLVSLRIANKAGILWDQTTDRLVQGTETWGLVQAIGDHYVVEYNKPNTALMATKSINSIKSTKPTNSGQFIKSTTAKPAEKATMQTWHRRFAHAGRTAISHLPNATQDVAISDIINAPNADSIEPKCEVCQLSKAKKQISRQPIQPPKAPYEIVALDLIEFEQSDTESDRYILHFLCRYTGMNHVYILPNKTQETVLRTIQDFTAFIQRRWDLIIRIFQLDGEKSLGRKWDSWIATAGITEHRTSPDTPEQNGSSERSGGVIIERSRALQIDSKLPKHLWPEIACAVGYLLNRTPQQKNNWITPIERLNRFKGIDNAKPKCSHIRIYGSKAYALNHKIARTDKLAPRANVGYLVGWDSTNIFRVWVPILKRVIRTRDVTFDESHGFDPKDLEITEMPEIINTIRLIALQEHDADTDADTEHYQHTIDPAEDNADATNQTLHQYSTQTKGVGLITPELTPEPIDQIDLSDTIIVDTSPNLDDTSLNATSTVLVSDASPDSATSIPQPNITRFESIPAHTRKTRDTTQGVNESNILEGIRTRKPRRQAYIAALERPDELTAFHTSFLAGTNEKRKRVHRTELPDAPRAWKDLINHAHADGFRCAAKKELDELNRRNTWKIIDRWSIDRTIKPLPLKWVFTYKFDKDGYLDRYKARICVRGDLQPPTEKDKYAATLAARIFRALIAIMARFGLKAVQLDAVNAFINARLDETVYCYPPDGFEMPGKLYWLLLALYGLPRSPLMWLNEFKGTLTELGLVQIPESPCLFTNGRIIVFFYVDDVVILYHPKHESEFYEFKAALLNKYEFKDLGDLKWFLGIRIVRDLEQHKVWLCQDSYIEKIARTFHLETGPRFDTPMATIHNNLLPNQNQATDQSIHAYQARIGSLIYAAINTRPDIARATNKLAEFMMNPSTEHSAAADRVIRYLYDTRYLAIQYSQNAGTTEVTTPDLHCSTDAAYADDIPTRKSTEGYLFKLFGGPIDWRSTKQKQVTRSSTEAELMALSHAATEIYWWRRLFTQIELDIKDYKVECDNQQTIRLLTTPAIKLATKLKHLDIHQHWLRQEIQANRLNIQWISTLEMPADGLTKALDRQKHKTFIKQLGLVDITALISAN
jgi:hypothetical protein